MFTACVLGLHLVTTHLDQNPVQPPFKDRTPGVYVKCDNGLTLGTLRNSYGRQSLYAGHTWERGPFSLTAGAISGYPAAPVLPFASAGLRLKLSEQAAWRVSFLPKAPKVGTSAAVHLSLELTGLLR